MAIIIDRDKIPHNTVMVILQFLTARHLGQVLFAKHAQEFLQKELGIQYTSIMLKYGDPDKEGFEKVFEAWSHEVTL